MSDILMSYLSIFGDILFFWKFWRHFGKFRKFWNFTVSEIIRNDFEKKVIILEFATLICPNYMFCKFRITFESLFLKICRFYVSNERISDGMGISDLPVQPKVKE